MKIFRILAGLAIVALLASCASRSERPEVGGFVTYGLYFASLPSDPTVTFSLSLSQNKTYTKRRHKDDCLLSETGGIWNADHEGLEFHMDRLRHRGDCDSAWEEKNEKKVSRRFIRGMSAASFELLDDGDGYMEPEWLTFRKRNL